MVRREILHHILVSSALCCIPAHAYIATPEGYEWSDHSVRLELYQCTPFREWSRDETERFEEVIAAVANKFCTAKFKKCNLLFWDTSRQFAPFHVRWVPEYPKIEVNTVELRFVLAYQVGMPLAKGDDVTSFVPKQTLTEIVDEAQDAIGNATSWKPLQFDRIPKYDDITEFMNIALIPIGIGIALLVVALAKCSAMVTKNEVSYTSNASAKRKFDSHDLKRKSHLYGDRQPASFDDHFWDAYHVEDETTDVKTKPIFTTQASADSYILEGSGTDVEPASPPPVLGTRAQRQRPGRPARGGMLSSFVGRLSPRRMRTPAASGGHGQSKMRILMPMRLHHHQVRIKHEHSGGFIGGRKGSKLY